MRNAVVLAMCAAVAAGLLGCEPEGRTMDYSEGDPPIRVAFVTNNVSDFWKIAKAGTRKAEIDFDCRVTFRTPPNGTAQEQQAIVEDLVAMGVSGIAISPKDPVNQTEMLNAAAAAVKAISESATPTKWPATRSTMPGNPGALGIRSW